MSERIDRLREAPDPELAAKLETLIRKLVKRLDAGEDGSALVAEINALANHDYTPDDFTDLESWSSPREAAELAAKGGPVEIEDLDRAELIEMVETIGAEEDPIASYFLEVLEKNLPESDATSLIYYPFRHELSADEVVDEMLLRDSIWKTQGDEAVHERMMEQARTVLADPDAAPWSREWAEDMIEDDA